MDYDTSLVRLVSSVSFKSTNSRIENMLNVLKVALIGVQALLIYGTLYSLRNCHRVWSQGFPMSEELTRSKFKLLIIEANHLSCIKMTLEAREKLRLAETLARENDWVLLIKTWAKIDPNKAIELLNKFSVGAMHLAREVQEEAIDKEKVKPLIKEILKKATAAIEKKEIQNSKRLWDTRARSYIKLSNLYRELGMKDEALRALHLAKESWETINNLEKASLMLAAAQEYDKLGYEGNKEDLIEEAKTTLGLAEESWETINDLEKSTLLLTAAKEWEKLGLNKKRDQLISEAEKIGADLQGNARIDHLIAIMGAYGLDHHKFNDLKTEVLCLILTADEWQRISAYFKMASLDVNDAYLYLDYVQGQLEKFKLNQEQQSKIFNYLLELAEGYHGINENNKAIESLKKAEKIIENKTDHSRGFLIDSLASTYVSINRDNDAIRIIQEFYAEKPKPENLYKKFVHIRSFSRLKIKNEEEKKTLLQKILTTTESWLPDVPQHTIDAATQELVDGYAQLDTNKAHALLKDNQENKKKAQMQSEAIVALTCSTYLTTLNFFPQYTQHLSLCITVIGTVSKFVHLYKSS